MADPIGDEQKETPPGQVGFSVIALILRDFSRHAVAEQAKLKSQLEALTAIAIQRLSQSGRLVLDTLDGLVIVVLSGPEHALEVAESAQAAAADLPVCIAVNYGPVKKSADAGDSPRFVGDGIVSAVTLANLATRGRLLLSRPFRDALNTAAPQRITALTPIGALTDASLRSHELFTLDPAAAAAVRRRFMLTAGAAALGILGIGVATRLLHAKPAMIQFEISPHGEVFVDGELRGKSPPLSRLAVSPGAHTIEVHNDAYAPLRLQMNLKPAEEMKVTHAFGGRKPRKQGDSFVEDVWRRLTR
jgi:PEGA domain-containing protein